MRGGAFTMCMQLGMLSLKCAMKLVGQQRGVVCMLIPRGGDTSFWQLGTRILGLVSRVSGAVTYGSRISATAHRWNDTAMALGSFDVDAEIADGRH